jgi:hypothetical protein
VNQIQGLLERSMSLFEVTQQPLEHLHMLAPELLSVPTHYELQQFLEAK